MCNYDLPPNPSFFKIEYFCTGCENVSKCWIRKGTSPPVIYCAFCRKSLNPPSREAPIEL